MKCPVDIQWKCRATECVNLEFSGDVWTWAINLGTISIQMVKPWTGWECGVGKDRKKIQELRPGIPQH